MGGGTGAYDIVCRLPLTIIVFSLSMLPFAFPHFTSQSGYICSFSKLSCVSVQGCEETQPETVLRRDLSLSTCVYVFMGALENHLISVLLLLPYCTGIDFGK